MKFGKRFESEKEKMKNMKDKDSEEYRKQGDIVLEVSNQFSLKTKEVEKLKEQAKNTIAVVKMSLQRNIDNLTQKVLEAQNQKNNLEAEIENLETSKSEYEKFIEQYAADTKISKDKKELVTKETMEEVQKVKDEISLRKSKMVYILVEVQEYISQIDEMKDNFKYLDYDEIEKYEVKEADKDEKDSKEEIQEQKDAREKSSEDEQLTPEEKAKKEEAARKETEVKLAQEKEAREKAEAKLAQEQAKRQKLEQEKAGREKEEEEKRKTQEQAEREKTNKPYKEGEELPTEQTEEMKTEEDMRPTLYISEADGLIAYFRDNVKDFEKGTTIREALNEKKEKYNRLNIKGICKEIAGKRIASAILYSKINPRIIKALENEPEMIQNYIEAIHNKEPLPFKLIHNVAKRSMIQRVLAMRYTIAEKASGAIIQTSNMLIDGRNNMQQKSKYSLLELLDSTKISESQKTAIKDYAIINGEDKAKREYAHMLPHEDKLGSKDDLDEDIVRLEKKGLFSEKRENADFVPRVGKKDGELEENARKSAKNKEEKNKEKGKGEIVSSGLGE